MNDQATQHCQNCGRPLLAGDTECWQCGWTLAGEERSIAEEAGSPEIGSNHPRLELRTISFYAGLTLALAIATWWLIRSLAAAPLADVELVLTPPAGWTTVVGETTAFSLMLPPNWNWLEGEAGDRRNMEELLELRPEVGVVLAPLFGSVSETEVILFASGLSQEEDVAASGFLLVAQDMRQAPLSPEEALRLLRARANGAQLLGATLFKDLRSTTRGAFLVELGEAEPRLQCREEFVSEGGASFLVAACTGSAYYPAFASSFQVMARSFRVTDG